MGGGDFGGGWSGSSSLARLKEQRQFGLRLGGAGQLEFAAVSSARVNLDHLNGGEFVDTLRGLRPGASAFRRRPRVKIALVGATARFHPKPRRAQATSTVCGIPDVQDRRRCRGSANFG
jgi:hypothetical protein